MQSTVTLYPGDNRLSLQRLIDDGVRVHSVVTDPPYGLVSVQKRFGKEGSAAARTEGTDGSFARLSGGFMGKAWDGTGIERDPEFWKLIYDILLPGGYVFAFSGSRTGHWQACALETAGFVLHPMHGWVFGCMDPETECLTRRGWLRYTDLLPTDEVLQWDSEADLLSWVAPQHIHEYDFDGDMVQIKNRHTHQVLTPNHRVYAKIRRHSRHPKPIAYEVIESRFVDSRPGNYQVDLPIASFLEGSQNFDVELAYLVGWWLTDAWAHKDANAVCFSQSKPVTLAKLREALSKWNPSEYVKKARKETHADEHMFYLSGPLADLLRSDFPERKLMWNMLDWSIEARRALYEGLMDGDGSRNRPGKGSYPSHAEAFWSKDQDRRDVFLALALSIGIRCYEDPVKGVVYVNHKTRTTQVQGKHRADRLPYRGKVWCLTVPTGAFVVRRGGRPFITGNSGFPKAHNASKAIDKALSQQGGKGAVRGASGSKRNSMAGDFTGGEYHDYLPATEEAAQWEGWAYGTQTQKPALEPIYLGQKPFSEKTGAANLLTHGVGAVNIDGCRVPVNPEADASQLRTMQRGQRTDDLNGQEWGMSKGGADAPQVVRAEGRHPANLILDGSSEVVSMFPDSKGQQGDLKGHDKKRQSPNGVFGEMGAAADHQARNDSGSAARFFHQFTPDADPLFYHPKAGKLDRAGSKHPTVKPIALMQYLIRHITPPGGIVLDPFAGSGTTAEAARREGFDVILMEAEQEYVDFLNQRFNLGHAERSDSLTDLTDLLDNVTNDLLV